MHPNSKECVGVWIKPPTQGFYLLIGLSCEDFRGHYNCFVGIQMHNKLLWVLLVNRFPAEKSGDQLHVDGKQRSI